MDIIHKILALQWTGHEKIDCYDSDWMTWTIGTIINYQIIHKAKNRTKRRNCNLIKLDIKYDGYNHRCIEHVYICLKNQCNKHPLNQHNVHSKIRKFHSMTPCHDYLIYDTNDEYIDESKRIYQCEPQYDRYGHWRTPNNYTCFWCDRYCCGECFAIPTTTRKCEKKHICKDCFVIRYYGAIFKSIYTAIYGKYSIDVNVIKIITSFALISDKDEDCGWECAWCHEDITYEAQFEKNTLERCHRLDIECILEENYVERRFFCTDDTCGHVHASKKELYCKLYHDEKDKTHCELCKDPICYGCKQAFVCNEYRCDKNLCKKCNQKYMRNLRKRSLKSWINSRQCIKKDRCAFCNGAKIKYWDEVLWSMYMLCVGWIWAYISSFTIQCYHILFLLFVCFIASVWVLFENSSYGAQVFIADDFIV